MDLLQQHEISESEHRILNPFTDEKLMLLGEICRLQPGQRVLDLASGKGEMLCRWAQAFGIVGTGVDISTVFVPAAEERASELGVADRVSFVREDAGSYQAEKSAYDVVSCIGATWIGGGIGGTIELMRRALLPTGLLLVGEPFWLEEPPEAAYQAMEVDPGEFVSLDETRARVESAGMTVVEMVLADGNSWDRYAAGQWWAVDAWLRDNQDHPDASSMREFLERHRRSYLQYGRRYLGWGVFVMRPALSST